MKFFLIFTLLFASCYGATPEELAISKMNIYERVFLCKLSNTILEAEYKMNHANEQSNIELYNYFKGIYEQTQKIKDYYITNMNWTNNMNWSNQAK